MFVMGRLGEYRRIRVVEAHVLALDPLHLRYVQEVRALLLGYSLTRRGPNGRDANSLASNHQERFHILFQSPWAAVRDHRDVIAGATFHKWTRSSAQIQSRDHPTSCVLHSILRSLWR